MFSIENAAIVNSANRPGELAILYLAFSWWNTHGKMFIFRHFRIEIDTSLSVLVSHQDRLGKPSAAASHTEIFSLFVGKFSQINMLP
jgi:hypothetical protein